MRKSNDRPDEPLENDEYWRRLGREDGRRNEPRTATGDCGARVLLTASWKTGLYAEHDAVVDALEALDDRRRENRHRLQSVHHLAATDPHQASSLQPLFKKDEDLAEERDTTCRLYLAQLDTLTHRAEECDSIWRTANEQKRDRQLTLALTPLLMPAQVQDLPPDPFA